MPKAKTKKQLNDDNNEIINFYELKKVKKFLKEGINPNYAQHKIKVPFRGIFVGASGAGKTNVLLNIIAKFANTFNHIYIYTRAEEPLYDYLESQIDKSLLTIKYDLASCQSFKDENYYGQSLVIFDDMVNEKDAQQQCIKELYIRGRKLAGGVSLLYLTQNYYKVPKIIRGQTQYIVIIKVSGQRDLNMILSEYSLNANKEQLNNMYNYCCNNGQFANFMLVDLNASQDKTYRKNFKEYLNIEEF